METPVDIIEYLNEAAIEIAQEKTFQPESESALVDWMVENRAAIIQRAIEIQRDLVVRLNENPEAKEAVVEILAGRTYTGILNREQAIREARALATY